MNPIEAVVVTTFSKLQMKPDAYRSSFLELFETIAVVGFLFTGMCFALAHPLTLVVLGPKWEQAAIIFAGLTFGALQYPLSTPPAGSSPARGAAEIHFSQIRLAQSLWQLLLLLACRSGRPE